MFRFLGWAALIVFIIGLLVVFGVLMMLGVLQQLSRWMPAFSPGGL